MDHGVCPKCGGKLECVDILNAHLVCDTCPYEENVLGAIKKKEVLTVQESEAVKIEYSVITGKNSVGTVIYFSGLDDGQIKTTSDITKCNHYEDRSSAGGISKLIVELWDPEFVGAKVVSHAVTIIKERRMH